MDLRNILSQVMDNLGGLTVTSPPALRVINRAVEHLVNAVEQTAQLWNVAASAKSLSVVSGTLEYQINTTDVNPRKIVSIERTDLTNNVDCVLISWRERNRYRNRGRWGNEWTGGNRPYVWVERLADGNWWLGFPADPQTTMTIDVYYAPRITELVDDYDEPTEIPEQFHELIVLRATIMLLLQDKQNPRAWQEMYAEQLQLMQADLERWNRTGPRVKQYRKNARYGSRNR